MKEVKDVDLLGMLIGPALATEMYSAYDNDIRTLARFIGTRSVKGVGCRINDIVKAAFELGRRKEKADEIERLNAQVVNSSKAVFAQFNSDLSNLDHEELWGLYLSKNGKILNRVRLSTGGTDFSGADIKMIVRPAIELGAVNVAICHNHPHSSTRPSQEDKNVTRKAKDALSLFDVRLIDHVIISDGRYYSFAEMGEI